MPYTFRILGPVAVFREGRPLPSGPPKRLALVAALLLEPNRPVPVQALAAAMWADPPPTSAVANVRSHAAALRRVLGDRLATRNSAYELRVDDGRLDAAEFTRLAADGRRALAAGAAADAIARLGDALALWKGNAGGGLPPGTSLAPRLLALDEQRQTVFADHAQARLDTGAYHDAAADLRRHLSTWPEQERCWELLMLALYRGGNTAGALEAYAEARAYLKEELGIEPGARLRQLQRAILERDPSLDTPTSRTVTLTAPRPIPAPAPAALVGRDRELARLTTAIRAGRPLVLLTGRVGIGKTALALRAVETTRDEFPGGQIIVDLAGEPPPSPSLDRYAAPALIVLDHVTSTSQIRPWLAAAATVLAITHRRLTGLDHAHEIEIGPISDHAAAGVIAAYAGEDRIAEDHTGVRDLVRICDGLPLALRIVGDWLARRSQLRASAIARHLNHRPLDGLQLGELSVRDALTTQYRTVTEEDPIAGRVFPELASHEPGAAVTPEELAHRLDQDETLVFYALERLVDARLADTPSPGQYRVTGLIHAYATELREVPEV